MAFQVLGLHGHRCSSGFTLCFVEKRNIEDLISIPSEGSAVEHIGRNISAQVDCGI
jgi:hypothetical protein